MSSWDMQIGHNTMSAIQAMAQGQEKQVEVCNDISAALQAMLNAQRETNKILEGCLTNNSATKTKLYIVCLDRSFIRDAQVYTKENANEANLFAEENEDGWQDLDMHGFVGLFKAASAEKAKMRASVMYHYPTDILWADEVKVEVAL